MYSDARLTMRLPGGDLSFVKEYAQSRGTTLTELFLGYIRELRSAVAEKTEYPASVRSMVGIIPASARDSVDEYHDYLMEKYA